MNDGACQITTGQRDRKGYGVKKVNGHRMRAHRWVWEQAYGPIPAGLVVMHLCDNPGCLNLDHLVLGREAANHLDKMNKGRQARGSRNFKARITELDIPEIRAAYTAGETQTSIAARYGLHPSTVSCICSRKIWRHVV